MFSGGRGPAGRGTPPAVMADVVWFGAVDDDREEYVFGIGDLHNRRITGGSCP